MMNKTEAWERLCQRWRKCTLCELATTRNRIVMGDGPLDSPLMVVGEAPGHYEDISGKPFRGQSGDLLRKAIKDADGPEPFITNVIACRPPNNRDPELRELLGCRSRIESTIKIVDPKIILIVGRIAFNDLTGIQEAIGRWRGNTVVVIFYWKNRKMIYNAMPTYHPAYILRNRTYKDYWIQDIEAALRYI